MQRFCKN